MAARYSNSAPRRSPGSASGILDCVKAGESASADVVADATAVWVALHGTVRLRTALPGFPWPELGQFVSHLIRSLARLTA